MIKNSAGTKKKKCTDKESKRENDGYCRKDY